MKKWIFPLLGFLGGFPAAAITPAPETAVRDKNEETVIAEKNIAEKKERTERGNRLADLAVELYFAIVKKDNKAILAMVDPEGGISTKKGGLVYHDDLARDLRQKNGHFACILYGCSSSKKASARSKLKKIPPDHLAIEIRFLYDMEWAGVLYSHSSERTLASADAKEDFYVGEYERPELTFRYKNGRWYIISLFE